MNKPPSPVTIRKATAEDSALIVQFVEKLITELDGKKPKGMAHSSLDTCRAMLSDHHNACFIAVHNNKEVGIITVVESNAIYAGGSFGIINELYVIPTYRSSGIGTLLIEEVVKFGTQNSWKRLEVGTPPKEEWRRTIDFYRREGFIEIGSRLKKHL
jgi:GNAT superfamily N-acetyltransferase